VGACLPAKTNEIRALISNVAGDNSPHYKSVSQTDLLLFTGMKSTGKRLWAVESTWGQEGSNLGVRDLGGQLKEAEGTVLGRQVMVQGDLAAMPPRKRQQKARGCHRQGHESASTVIIACENEELIFVLGGPRERCLGSGGQEFSLITATKKAIGQGRRLIREYKNSSTFVGLVKKETKKGRAELSPMPHKSM
jgi:hypothetical protein